MVVSHHGNKIGIRELRRRHALSLKGATLAQIKATRQPLGATAELYQRIAMNQEATGLSGAVLARVVETISKTMVISGSTSASAVAALVQLGQAFASGTLRGEELNSVMEQAQALTTVPTRYSVTCDLPAVDGANVGTNMDGYIRVLFELCGGQAGVQNGQFAFRDFKVERGDTATAFVDEDPATLLARCYRYCEPVEFVQLTGITFTTNGDSRAGRPLKVRKRVNPSLTYTGTMNVIASGSAGHVLNIDLGALQLGADTDVVVLVGIGNPGGLAPAGAVVSWGDNGSGRCTVLADPEF